MKKNYTLLFVFTLFLFAVSSIRAQEISAPGFYICNEFSCDIDNIRAIACASTDNPDRGVSAEYNGPSGFFGPGTEFLLELSDEEGVFSNEGTRVLTTLFLETAISSSATLDFGVFDIPEDLGGDNYSMRIRVEDPEFTTVALGLPIHYFDISQGVILRGPNIEARNAGLCSGVPTTLQVLSGDLLEYKWFFNGMDIPGETSNTLQNVTEPGKYTVEIDFGTCNTFGGTAYSFARANINVFSFDATEVFINEQGASPVEFCPEETKQLTCSITDPAYTYTWFRNGMVIADSNTSFLTLPQSNFDGEYTVKVTENENCSFTTEAVEVINLGSDITSQPPPQLVILPTETITLSITTNAPAGSTIQWFENDTPIVDANEDNITVTTPGVYRAEVFTNDLCRSTLVAETTVSIPVNFRLEISRIIDCDENSAILAFENLFGITSDGLEVSLPTEQLELFSFEWLRETIPTGETGNFLTVNRAEENVSYTFLATFNSGGFPPITSQSVVIPLSAEGIEIIADSPFLPVNGSIVLSVPQSELYTYDWFVEIQGNFQLIVGETTNMLTITEEGNYKAVITYEDCTEEDTITIGNTPGISELIPNVITPNGSLGMNDDWVLPDVYKSPAVTVEIYSYNGALDFKKSGGYNQDWPSNSVSGGSELIYYYIITKNNAIIKKGTITVMDK
ncbi:gliding motility-associated C-terminal domain-containing protein [Aquimarina sp. RZ0]|uniref:T9SS type B sorting domain-containing protein n=1 Tax=Aquimarina sp. RZ0 TaxID=2607730 RepID=UPI0011F29982|nr:gliding motility-associated C-terminal domain-containing protein [Aquimarina sp. RZ0]KAA1247360.1 hypothetical protein F0000_04235 [Aquimarina sp. RZ0]